jgi:HSP20 family protein
MDEMLREMQPVLTNLLLAGPQHWSQARFLPGLFARAYPRINVAEDKDHIYVEALAPGVDPSTLNVTVQRNVLTIEGAKPAPEGVRSEAYYVSERAAGKFTRSIELPALVDGDKVEASYVDGLITVKLPKAEEAKPKQIQVAIS